MIVLAEASEQLPPSASARDIAASTNAARLAGATVYTIPPDFEQCETATNALAHVPAQVSPVPTFWIGYIPDPARYAAIFDAARAKNLLLPNTLDEHANAQEFDRTYPRIAALTARTAFVSRVDANDLAAAVSAVGGYPVFVKGAVQSRKAKGYKACVAASPDELAALVAALLDLENRSRGRVAVRELLPLRVAGTAPNGFPMGREFRVFVYQNTVVGAGYYWEAAQNPLETLTPSESQTVHALAVDTARRVGTPYIAVDIGELVGGEWRVIETGDAQFSGLSQIGRIALWSRLRQSV